MRAVSSGGVSLAFTHLGDRLAMTLAAPSAQGQVTEFVVRYAGIPADGLLIKPNAHGDRTFFSRRLARQGAPVAPTIDHLRQGEHGDGRHRAGALPGHLQRTTHGGDRCIRRHAPHRLASRSPAPWLHVLGVARFAAQHVGDYNGIPLGTWVFHKDRDAGFHDFAVLVKEGDGLPLEFIGPSSYEKLANVQSNLGERRDGGRLGHLLQRRERDRDASVRWRNVIIHEIAHQWWGTPSPRRTGTTSG
ncbi:MAG: hypothetical protein IPK33_11040 [Gemmatimonadetes bacterium]|nr:hypothetical protein [Gemmatimonadota bacterium]